MYNNYLLSPSRIKTEQANEIARLIRQYITIDQKSREIGANQVYENFLIIILKTFYETGQ